MSTTAELSPDVNRDDDQRLGSHLDTLLTERSWKRSCLFFLFLGVAVRLVRYLLCFPLWNDEMALAENFLNRDFSGLLEPLTNGQVAPILFLWTELAVIKLAGFSEYSLRVLPLTCGIASLFVFYHFAGQYLKGLPRLMAVAVFSVSYYPIRHAAEVKPYAVDIFVTTVLLCVATTYLRSGQLKWLMILTAITPLALGFSFPSVFILGGISLSLLMPVFVRGSNAERAVFVLFNLGLLMTFLMLHFASTAESYNVQFEQIMGVYWVDGFLPRDRPWLIPVWLLKVCTSHCFEYPLGGDNGAGTLPFVGLVVGGVIMFRRYDSRIVILGMGAVLLALIASAIQRYPFGGHARLMQYLAPLACLLIGVGFVAILEMFRPQRIQQRSIYLSLGILATLPIVVMIQDINHPYKRIHYQQHRDLAHTIWQSSQSETPLYCLMQSRSYAPTWEHFPYLCSQMIETKGDFVALPDRENLDASNTYRAVVWYRIRDVKKGYPLWKAELQKQFAIHDREVFTIEAAEYTETFEVLTLQPVSPYRPAEITASRSEKELTTQ